MNKTLIQHEISLTMPSFDTWETSSKRRMQINDEGERYLHEGSKFEHLVTTQAFDRTNNILYQQTFTA